MKVLLVGSGGREHALALALSGSPLLQELLIAPGSPALGRLGRLVAVAAEDTDQLCALAEKEQVDLVVIGPELPLVNGLADRLDSLGIAAHAQQPPGWKDPRNLRVIFAPATLSRNRLLPRLMSQHLRSVLPTA
jgi:hypothetical protein